MASVNWDNAFDTHPVGTDFVADGDNRIMDTRQTVRDLLETEHDAHQINADYTDTGRHKEGSARAFFEQGSVAEPDALRRFSNAGAWPAVLDDNDKQASDALDNGRLWVDWDDGMLYFREEEIRGAAWTDINTNYGGGAANWIQVYPRTWTEVDVATNDNQQNAAGPNVREDIDGAGVGAAMGVTIDVPDDGKNYEIVVEATVAYYLNGTRGAAFWLVEDDGVAPVDVDYKVAYGSGGVVGGSMNLVYVWDATGENGNSFDYTVQFCCSVNAATAVINPDLNGLGLGAPYNAAPYTAAPMNGDSMSRIKATIKPLHETGDYCF